MFFAAPIKGEIQSRFKLSLVERVKNFEQNSDINSLICIFRSTVQEIFHWKTWKLKLSYLIFYPIWIKFSLFYSTFFLSIELP